MSVLLSIKHVASGKWLSATTHQPESNSIAANADWRGPAATFSLSKAQDGTCQLHLASPNKLIGLDPSGKLVCVSPTTAGTTAAPFQIQQIIIGAQRPSMSGLTFNQPLALKSPGGYATVGSDGTLSMNATYVGKAEIFELHLPVLEQLIVATNPPARLAVNSRNQLFAESTVNPLQSDADAVWLLMSENRGTYTISHRRTGLVLDYTITNHFCILARSRGDYQRWKIESDGDSFILTHAASGLRLGVSPDSNMNLPDGKYWTLSPHIAIEPNVLDSPMLGQLFSDNDIGNCPTGISSRQFAAWMSFIHDDTRLIDLVIPGTHDSGTYNMDWGGTLTGSITQGYNLLGQLLLGARFLDVRVTRATNGTDLCIDHGGIHGGWFKPMMHQVRTFISQMPGEIVINTYDCQRRM